MPRGRESCVFLCRHPEAPNIRTAVTGYRLVRTERKLAHPDVSGRDDPSDSFSQALALRVFQRRTLSEATPVCLGLEQPRRASTQAQTSPSYDHTWEGIISSPVIGSMNGL